MIEFLLPHAKWLRRSLAVGLGCLATVSCKKEAEPGIIVVNDSHYTVSEVQARTIAENIYASDEIIAQRKHNQQTGDTQRVFRGRQRLSSLTAVPAADGKPGFYLCNYERGGFALIAADRHMRPLLAFAEHGSLPADAKQLSNPQAMPEGLLTWLENTKRMAATLRQYPTKENVVAGAPEAWASMVAPICPDLGDGEPADCPEPTWTSTQRGPLLQTNWGQGCNYNDEVTSSQRSDYCFHCPTGCVATAMAQVMNYWHYPATAFNWGAMSNNQGTPATAHLMKECGDAVHMDYKEGGSSADDDYIDDKLKGWYGYSSATYISSQAPGLYQDVVNNLNYGWPVVLGGFAGAGAFGWYGTGAAHCWVADGYIQSYYNGNGYLSYHMNWGYSGQYNCWCAYNNWQYTDLAGNAHSYNYVTSITLNIHP